MEDSEYIQIMAFLSRETHWTLTEIKAFHVESLGPLIDELKYQKAMDDYRAQANAALIAVTFNRSQGGKATIEELIGEPPERGKPQKRGGQSIWQMAQQVGIQGPLSS